LLYDAKQHDFKKFDDEWTQLGREFARLLYINPASRNKKFPAKKRLLTLEEKSEFINLCDKIKYDLIYAKYETKTVRLCAV